MGKTPIVVQVNNAVTENAYHTNVRAFQRFHAERMRSVLFQPPKNIVAMVHAAMTATVSPLRKRQSPFLQQLLFVFL